MAATGWVRWLCVLVLLSASVGVAGCAGTVTTAAGQRLPIASPEFRDYVERVFRQQNQVATQLAFAVEDAEDASASQLVRAEESLLAACAGLNQLATARRDGQRLGPLKQAEAARQAPRCEHALGEARTALERNGG